MKIALFIILYIVFGTITTIAFRVFDMIHHHNKEEDFAMTCICGGLWPAVWVCVVIFVVLWCIYKPLESLISRVARFIYEIVMKNKHI